MALTGGGGWGGGCEPRSPCLGAAKNPGFTPHLRPRGIVWFRGFHLQTPWPVLAAATLGVNPCPLPPSRRASEARATWVTPEPALQPDAPAPGGSTGGTCSGGTGPTRGPAGGSRQSSAAACPPESPPGEGAGCHRAEPAQREGDPPTRPISTASSLGWHAPWLPRCPNPRCQGRCRACGPSHMDGKTPVVPVA